jgi:hypothetical protein
MSDIRYAYGLLDNSGHKPLIGNYNYGTIKDTETIHNFKNKNKINRPNIDVFSAIKECKKCNNTKDITPLVNDGGSIFMCNKCKNVYKL